MNLTRVILKFLLKYQLSKSQSLHEEILSNIRSDRKVRVQYLWRKSWTTQSL